MVDGQRTGWLRRSSAGWGLEKHLALVEVEVGEVVGEVEVEWSLDPLLRIRLETVVMEAAVVEVVVAVVVEPRKDLQLQFHLVKYVMVREMLEVKCNMVLQPLCCLLKTVCLKEVVVEVESQKNVRVENF